MTTQNSGSDESRLVFEGTTPGFAKEVGDFCRTSGEIVEGRVVVSVSETLLEQILKDLNGVASSGERLKGLRRVTILHPSGRLQVIKGPSQRDDLVKNSRGRNLRLNALPEELDQLPPGKAVRFL